MNLIFACLAIPVCSDVSCLLEVRLRVFTKVQLKLRLFLLSALVTWAASRCPFSPKTMINNKKKPSEKLQYAIVQNLLELKGLSRRLLLTKTEFVSKDFPCL